MADVNEAGAAAAPAGLVFRMYRAADRQQLFGLWEDFIAPGRLARRQDLFDWLVTRNPALGGRSPYHVVLDGERLVAHYGKMPVRFLVHGRPLGAFICHDVYVQRRYRGRSAGLSEALVGELLNEPGTFVLALWFARFNYGLHRRCGWLEIPGCRGQVKVYDPAPFLRGRLPRPLAGAARAAGRALLALLDLRIRRPGPRLEVRPIHAFDERFDALAGEVCPRLGIVAIRDGAYLNWKYAQRPHMRYQILAAEEDGRLRGYIVSRAERGGDGAKGLIVDALAPPERADVFRALVLAALEDLRRERVAYVSCVFTHPAFRRVLRSCNFLTAREPSPVMIGNWRGPLAPEEVADVSSWYLTRGDGDGDFWTTG